METSGAKTRPGYKTTEFWLATLSAIVGVVLASGLADDSAVMKVAGLFATLLSGLGYGVVRAGVKKALIVLFALALPLFGAGCQKGMIRADAIAGLVEDVSNRHDKLLKGEIKPETVSAQDKETFLRSTELLRRTVKEARAP